MIDPQDEPFIKPLTIHQRLQVKKSLDLEAWALSKTPEEILNGRTLDEYAHDMAKFIPDDIDLYKMDRAINDY